MAFSSEADTGSREENASRTNTQSFGSDSIRTEIAVAASRSQSRARRGCQCWTN